MRIGSSASHVDSTPLELLAKPSFTPRPSIDGATGTPARGAGDAFGALMNGAGTASELMNGTGLASGLLSPLFGGGEAAGQQPEQLPSASAGGGFGALAATAGEAALGAVPVVGNVMSGVQALQALSKGDVGDAALDAVGVLPGIGNGVKLAEGGLKLAEGAAKLL